MRRVPITKKLFSTYTVLFMVFYLLSVTAAVLFMAHDINKSIIDTQKQMAQTISRSIEQYFEDVNSFSLSLMNSNAFKQAVLVDLPSAQDATNTSAAWQNVYSAAHEMFSKGYRVGVVNKNGAYIWLGSRILCEQMSEKIAVYDEYNGTGKPILLPMEENPYLAALSKGGKPITDNAPTLVLARSINLHNQFAKPQAMLEIHVGQNEFNRFVESLASSANIEGMRVLIVNKENQVLYGTQNSDIEALNKAMLTEDWQRVNGNMMQQRTIFSGGARVVYEIPASVYYEKLTTFIIAAVAFSVLLCILLIFVTYRISKSLSLPINKMCRQLEQIDLGEAIEFKKVNTDIYELDLMAETVTNLNDKLIDTLDDIVSLKTAEMQSRLMALQSQMQPHFLHNTLAAIASLGDAGDCEGVTNMCNNLSRMLRYVSAKAEDVTLFEELKFLKNYVEIMRERFPTAQVHIDIPIELMQQKVPKLVLQPLCENSFKYAGRLDTEIWLEGASTERGWQVSVRDNGNGFSDEKAAEILAHCRSVHENRAELSANIDGMGLVNIYARLALYTKNNFIFEINAENGITIGGKAT